MQGGNSAPVVTADINGLVPGVNYYVRALCENYGGGVGPFVGSSPAFVIPQPPRITAVTTTGALPTGGGQPILLFGSQLGGVGVPLILTLVGSALNLTSTACSVCVSAMLWGDLSCLHTAQ